MSEFQDLTDALICLSRSISNFPVRALSLDDLKPVEVRITNVKKSLKNIKARLLMIKAFHEFHITNEELQEDVKRTIKRFNKTTGNYLKTNAAIKVCLHSYSLQGILSDEKSDCNVQNKIYACMYKLFTLNNETLSLQNEIESVTVRQLELKSQCQDALFEYKNFLKNQEKMRNKKLQEIYPEIAQRKEKVSKKLRNINIMKKLIVELIAASSHMLLEKPILVEMLEKYQEVITTETIFEMVQNSEKEKNENVNNIAC